MAISDAMRYRMNTGGSAEDLYATIRDFLAASPDAAATQAAMKQYGISGEDVANATGGKSGGLLSGNILAGASWNSSNTALKNQLTEVTGQQTANYAVAGSTTTDTLKQLNTFLAGGGQFDPNATVYLQAGGVDFITGVDKTVVKDNLNQIVKTLGDQGVNVVLTGSPYAKSVDDVINNKFDPKVDQIYTDVAKANSNVALVGTQGEILQNKKLLVDALHTNAEGTAVYNQSVIDALSQFKNEVPSSTPQAIAQVQKSNTVPVAAPVIIKAAENKASIQDQLKNQILSQGTTSQWQGEGKGSADANAADMAKILVDTGITDLSQFGKVTKTVDVAVQPVYDYKEVDYGGETGVQLSPFIVGYTDQNGNAIDPSLVKTDVAQVGSGDNTSYETVYVAPVGKQEVFGNKVTGQEVANTYGERQTGDAFGGTYTGKGNTAYNVQFDESGKPVFYTTGASSSDTKDIARVIQAGLLLSGAGGALGGALGLTGAAAQGVGTGLITAGSTAIGGGSGSDILKAGLLGGGIAYGGNLLGNYLDTGSTADVGITERQFAVQDAKQLANQGLSTNQIKDTLAAGGYNDIVVERAISSLTGTPVAPLPTPGAVNVTGAATPAINAGLLGGLVSPTTTAATTTPVTQAGTVNVTGTAQPQMVDQATLALVNSQLASTVGTPANLANVQVTADKTASAKEITNAILATVPNTTIPQAQAQAQVLITSGQNLKTSDLVSAVAAVSPSITNTVAEQIITSSNSNAIQPVVSALVSTVTPTTTSNLANVQVTGDRVASTQEIANAVLATVPNITAQQAKTQAEVIVSSGQNLKVSDLVSAVASVSPNITSNIAEKIITSDRPVTTKDMAAIAAAVVPALATPSVPTQTIISQRPSSITDAVTAATIPLIQPSSPLTLPEIPRQPTTSNPLLNTLGSAGLSSLLSGLPNLISGGLGTAGNLLQMQTSREAAQRAQAMIEAETKAAKDAAQFRPIGMTTRFGTSQFGFDPATGRLSSAGYSLTPDVKAQQDRFMALSNQGLTQAEGAQAQFAPLQTGAQRLFGLGNQYLAQSPEAVAQNYLNQQMALLQPGREQELATLQNRLQQQGRGGLSVAQGGTMGATTPELQALYNARAQQEAVLAANAQQAGQRDVLFGAGLLGQGATAMGNYYSGQQGAYAPYTSAMTQAQNLETLGQQPYTMGIKLGEIGSQAGANVGTLGLRGAGLSTALATSADATRNLLAQGLTAAGNPNAQFGQVIGNTLGGLFGGGLQSAFSGTGLGSSGFGTGLAYGNQDLGLFL